MTSSRSSWSCLVTAGVPREDPKAQFRAPGLAPTSDKRRRLLQGDLSCPSAFAARGCRRRSRHCEAARRHRTEAPSATAGKRRAKLGSWARSALRMSAPRENTRRDPIVIAASVGQAGLGGLVLSLHQCPRCDGHHKFAVLRGSGGSFAGHAIQQGDSRTRREAATGLLNRHRQSRGRKSAHEKSSAGGRKLATLCLHSPGRAEYILWARVSQGAPGLVMLSSTCSYISAVTLLLQCTSGNAVLAQEGQATTATASANDRGDVCARSIEKVINLCMIRGLNNSPKPGEDWIAIVRKNGT